MMLRTGGSAGLGEFIGKRIDAGVPTLDTTGDGDV
jgi:hypothetical protein